VTVTAWIVTARRGSSAGLLAAPELPSRSVRTPCATRSSPAALDAGVPLRDVQEAASHADPRTTMRYDRARVSLDRHGTYTVSTYTAGAAC
jgi:integrase